MGIMASNCKNSLYVCDFAALVATACGMELRAGWSCVRDGAACGIERHDGSHGRACLDFSVVFLHFGCINLGTCIQYQCETK
jgi:hypothetical protein